MVVAYIPGQPTADASEQNSILELITQLTCQLFNSLGLVVNQKKSMQNPTQEIGFLTQTAGRTWNGKQMVGRSHNNFIRSTSVLIRSINSITISVAPT